MSVRLHYAPRTQGSTYTNIREFLDQKVSRENQAISLKISCKNLSDLKFLFEKLQNKKVVALDLSNSNLGDKEAKYIAEAVKTHHSMTKLVLSNNRIGDKGATLLSQLVGANPRLDIQLSHNRIGPQGGGAFAEAAAASGKTMVDLTYNKLGNEGAKLVGQKLQNNAGAIKKIFLKHNGIGFKGDKALAETVPSSITVYHRVKVIPFTKDHPFASLLLILFFPIPFLFILPFLKSEKDIPGCEYPR